MSFAPMVRTTDFGPFAGNALRFATREEAQMWLDDLMCRWFAVTDVRVDESTDPVNYRTVDGRTLEEVAP
jgi:hypothetical protein